MKINRATKISKIIDHNTDAIDVIAGINPHFKKLKNPILKKILAPRVSIEDAAKIGKCKVDDFFDALSKIGFEIDDEFKTQSTNLAVNPKINNAINNKKIISLDVRPILESGKDPFNAIMYEIKLLPESYALEVINTFEPVPLIKILKNKGYGSIVTTVGDLIYTYFLKIENSSNHAATNESINLVSIEQLEAKKLSYLGKCKEIDVRNMEMPMPMITILNEIEALQKDEALYVHHKKIPQYLLPELKERNVTTLISEIEEGNVKLLIHF